MNGRSALLVTLAAAALTAASIGVVDPSASTGRALATTDPAETAEQRHRGAALLRALAEELDVSPDDLEAAVRAVVEHELDLALEQGRLIPEHVSAIAERLDIRQGLGLVAFGGLRSPITP
jgi:hypothetical protein